MIAKFFHQVESNLLLIIAVVTIVSLNVYYHFSYPYAFNFSVNTNGQYFCTFLSTTAVLLMLVCVAYKFHSRSLPVAAYGIMFITVCLFVKSKSLSNEYISNIICSFNVIVVLILSRCFKFQYWYLIFLVFWLIECTLAAVEIIKNPSINNLEIKGYFENSGILASYLVINLPIFLYFISSTIFQNQFLNNSVFKNKRPDFDFHLKKMHSWQKLVVTFVCFVVLLVVVKTQSRTAIITLATILVCWLHPYCGKSLKSQFSKLSKKRRVILLSLIIIVVTIVMIIMVYMKRGSAIGRLLCWYIGTIHIFDNFWIGVGLGKFTWYYPQWQAEYFQKTSNIPLDFFFSGGENYIILNEYLQLFETIGLTGFICFVTLLFLFYKQRSIKWRFSLITLKTTVTGILISGVTSYPFHVNTLLLLFFGCVAIGLTLGQSNFNGRIITNFKYSKYLIVPILVFYLYASWTSLTKYLAIKEWIGFRHSEVLTPNEKLKRYTRLESDLKFDGKFLTQYGICLLEAGETDKAISVLESAKNNFISALTVEALSTAYWKKKNFQGAISNSIWLTNYVPFSFNYKYNLLLQYYESGDMVMAQKNALTILNMPVKIGSDEVEEIKREASKLLKSIKNTSESVK